MNKYKEVKVGENTYKVEYNAGGFRKAKSLYDVSIPLNRLQSFDSFDMADCFDFMLAGIAFHHDEAEIEQFLQDATLQDMAAFFDAFNGSVPTGQAQDDNKKK